MKMIMMVVHGPAQLRSRNVHVFFFLSFFKMENHYTELRIEWKYHRGIF